ncbi:MAG: quinone-dependent dihydroorotate dehydrogenase [Pseudomonadota bacterium]|jgi:dihydroorotate dehydrogenase
MYKYLVKPILFKLDPETAHDLMRSLCRCANYPIISAGLKSLFSVTDERLRTQVAGLSFSNPIGLAAGFDKNVELLGLWNGLGFGHLELGTVTAQAQPGNPRPRIFRLVRDRALINRMGFPSNGADAIEQRLKQVRCNLPSLPILGMNIGKSKNTEIDRAVEDYCYSFSHVHRYVDYVTVNVSSPNTPGLRQLQERGRLIELLLALQELNKDKKPLFVKLAPDLTFEAIDEVLQCCFEAQVSGVIATNTTVAREGLQTNIDQSGGLSGRPLFNRSLEVVRFIGSQLQGRLALIGVGGISGAEDVLAMLAAGADMVQVYTGLVYGGPGFVKSLNLGLLDFMDKHDCRSLKEAAEAWRAQAGSGTPNRAAV